MNIFPSDVVSGRMLAIQTFIGVTIKVPHKFSTSYSFILTDGTLHNIILF